MTTSLEFIKRNAFRKVLAPAAVTLLYACLAWLLTPEGINKAFSQLLLSAALLGLAAGLIVLLGELRRDTTTHPPTTHRLQTVDFFLPLLPLGPIVQYIILNSDILSGREIVQLVSVFTVATLLLVLVVPHLLSRWAARHLVFAAAIAALFVLFNMAAMARIFNWHLHGEAWIQALVFAVTFLACAGLYQRDKKMLMLLSVGLFATTSLQALFIEQEK